MTDKLVILTPMSGLSETRHNWDIFPANTMAYDMEFHRMQMFWMQPASPLVQEGEGTVCHRLPQCKQGRHLRTPCSSNQGFSGETGAQAVQGDKAQKSEHREVFLQQHCAGSIVTMDGGIVGSSITGATTSPTCTSGHRNGSITLHQDIVVFLSNSSKPPARAGFYH